VSVFLPEYSDSDWMALRGSIISSVSVVVSLQVKKSGPSDSVTTRTA
jgi:hypothetical protein